MHFLKYNQKIELLNVDLFNISSWWSVYIWVYIWDEKKWNDHLNRRSNVCLIQWKHFFGVCRFVIWDRSIYWVTVRCKNRVANFARLQLILDCVLCEPICFSGLKQRVFVIIKVVMNSIIIFGNVFFAERLINLCWKYVWAIFVVMHEGPMHFAIRKPVPS